jgi:hypothetical protein
MGEQPKPTVEDVARNCPSTCMFPFYIWGLVDTTSPSCRGCKELAEAIERGEVSVQGAELVNEVRSIMEEKLGKGEPALLVISPVINAEFDEHGNIVYKGIEGIELGILTPAEITPTQDGKAKAKMKYEKIAMLKPQQSGEKQ